MRVEAIIPAAGVGKRLKSKQPKPLITLAGKPLIIHTLTAFDQCGSVDQVILVVEPGRLEFFDRLIKQYRIRKVKRIVPGGATRKQSVANGLNLVDDQAKIVIVHDGARPFISPKLIDQAVAQCLKKGAVVVGVPVKSTIKKIDRRTLAVKETPDRSLLWEIQTPQAFKREILIKAHRSVKKEATDDAMMVELLGIPVYVVPGDYRNMKVTTPEDLVLAKALLLK